ncbi:MAG: hypothetical protein KDA55_05870 [Planctomycetales bacterium]|nr:hypothetical protein [Planctomycetales bacterium]
MNRVEVFPPFHDTPNDHYGLIKKYNYNAARYELRLLLLRSCYVHRWID